MERIAEGVGMRRQWAIVLAVALVGGALFAAPADADPGDCEEQEEQLLPIGEDHAHCESEEAQPTDPQGEAAVDELVHSQNMHLLSTIPNSGLFAATNPTRSDIAFWGDLAIAGNYDGFEIIDISEPEAPFVVGQHRCPGSQNDVSVWNNLVFTSTDSVRSDDSCSSGGGNASSPTAWEGIRIFDISNPAAPVYVKAVKTDCGSHTHTLVPDTANGRVLLYVSSYSPSATALNCLPPHDKISIVEVPLDNPTAAQVIAEPILFPTGGQSGTSGCHDITVYPAIGLAAGACMGEGIIMNIRDPENPQVLSTIVDPNFSFWHSATFSNDGDTVIFTDELGGGTAARCTEAYGPNRGADAFYDISDPSNPEFLSYFKIPRIQTTRENCVSHNGNVLPMPGRDIMVQAWYQGGTSVIDFTDRTNPVEIAYLERGPLHETNLVTGGAWSSYFYNGLIYVNDIKKGFETINLSDRASAGAGAYKLPYLNAQTQEPPTK